MLTPLLPNEIRLLYLRPTSAGATATCPIECDIKVTPLSSLPSYEALSYVWGTEEADAYALISGEPFLISRTLDKALRRLRLPNTTRLLWVDQLCIDQQNNSERAQQVQLMKAIYTNCTRCIIWMGEIRSGLRQVDAEAAVALLQYLADAENYRDSPDSHPVPEAVISNFHAACDAIEELGSPRNPWWDRIWTVQEAVLPEKFTMQWGSLEIPGETLEQAVDARDVPLPQTLKTLSSSDIDARHIVDSLSSHIVWLYNVRIYHTQPLLMIHMWRHRCARDARDKIYGLLGLLEPGTLPITEKSDYSIPPAKTFAILTLELILHERSLRPLTISTRQPVEKATPGIPSWAIDIGSPDHSSGPDRWHQLHSSKDTYHADNGLGRIDLDGIKAQIGRDCLTLRGVHIDTVVGINEGYKTDTVWIHNLAVTEPLLPQWYNFAVPNVYDNYPGCSYGRSEAFARLVLGDVVRDEMQVPVRKAGRKDIQDVGMIMGGQGTEVDDRIRWTVYGMMANQSLFITESGLMGSGPFDTEIGDQVWIFNGGCFPFVIRPQKDGSGHTFIGKSYVQGIMQGEMMRRSGTRHTEQMVCLY